MKTYLLKSFLIISALLLTLSLCFACTEAPDVTDDSAEQGSSPATEAVTNASTEALTELGSDSETTAQTEAQAETASADTDIETETAEETALDTASVAETELDTQAETEIETEALADALDFMGTPDVTYDCQDDSVLRTYKSKTADDFAQVRDYYTSLGYEVYSQNQKNGNDFITLVNDNAMAHIYYLAFNGELNVVTSDTAGATLPPKTPAVTTGDYPITVTQMQDKRHVNGMGYIIQLADGSFIVYDGAYADQSRSIMQYLQSAAGDNDILIRAWVLTHSHNDHYPAFHFFAQKYTKSVTVEHVIVAPIDEATAVATTGDSFFNTVLPEDIQKFKAKAVYAHTGMEFTFGSLRMEILLAADDLYKENKHENYFNNSSLVSRLYDDHYSFLVTADIGKAGCELMMDMYGDYLQSDICQVSHHGVEDAPLSFYELIKAPILYYPCSQWLYDLEDRNNDVRDALEEKDYTKEILIAELGQYTRLWGTTFADDAELSMPDYIPPEMTEETEIETEVEIETEIDTEVEIETETETDTETSTEEATEVGTQPEA